MFMTEKDNKIKWLWLTVKAGITKAKIKKLLEVFNNVDNIFEGKREDYEKLDFLEENHINSLCNKNTLYCEKLLSAMEKGKMDIITYDMEEYPRSLTDLSSYPYVLYWKGNLINLNNFNCISVVGSRTPCQYGKDTTQKICHNLSNKGFIIVSGMADGIDSVAHTAAVESGMPTVAVLGTGANIAYPRSNKKLYDKILEKGMIISEYVPNTLPEPFRFPERNKIIASLSMGTVVTEAAIKSGSLITSSIAKKLDREIFALPGNITSKLSDGTNKLITEGAHIILKHSDIYDYYEEKIGKEKLFEKMYSVPKEEINEILSTSQPDFSTDNDEKIIIDALKEENLTIDGLSYKTGFSITDLSTKLLFMELNGTVTKQAGDFYSLT